jgi:hypothetical protein
MLSTRGIAFSLATLVALCALIAALAGNLGTAVAARENCRQIEALKEQVRLGAERSLRELPRNAELLGIELTPAAIEQARQQRDRTLVEFAPRRCSIWIWK